MEALERRNASQLPEPAPPSAALTLASPPATPAKALAKVPKVGSRSNSSSNLASQKTRGGKKASTASPAKSNSKAKVERKPSAEHALPYPTGQGPPGIMVPGPDGVPVFAPIINYAGSAPEPATRPGASRPRSRSTSKQSRRESTPPERERLADQYYPPRSYYPPPALSGRPPSSGSNRSLPDDIDWYPPANRNRSTSNAPYPAAYGREYDDQMALPAAQTLPPQQPRRIASGPAAAQLRRMGPSSSPLAPQLRPAQLQHSSSDPSTALRRSGLGREVLLGEGSEGEESGSDDSEDQGVQVNVNIVPDGAGYSINRAPVSGMAVAAGASGGEARRRRGGRR